MSDVPDTARDMPILQEALAMTVTASNAPVLMIGPS